MPNWCEQELTIKGSKLKLKKFLDYAKTKRKCIDEEKFVPMPNELKESVSGSQEMLYDAFYGDISIFDHYEWIPKEIKGNREKIKEYFRKQYEDADKIAEMYKISMDKYGVKTWYEWALVNWGTKWGICHPTIDEEILEILLHTLNIKDVKEGTLLYHFESAWSPADRIVQKMSEIFKDLVFTLEFWESGCGYKGKYVFKNGEMLEATEEKYHGDRGG